MKRITLLSTLVGAFLFSTTAMAQGISDADAEKFISVSTQATSIEEGSWYVLEQQRGGVSYMYANASQNKAYRMPNNNTAVTLNGKSVEDNKAALICFKKNDGADTYKLVFGTGVYLSTPTHNNNITITSDVSQAGALYINKVTKQDNSVTFQFGTTAAGGTLMDNNGGGNALGGWNDPFKTVVDGNVGNSEWRAYKVTLIGSINATINVKNSDDSDVQYTRTMKLPANSSVTLKDLLPTFSFVSYNNTTVTTGTTDAIYELGYTVDEKAEAAFPFVTSYDQLNDTKWVSMFTLNGRMHVRDTKDGANVAKYPTIDKATFTRLNDNYFWGFVRASRFSPTYIVNKAAGADQHLFLTADGNDRAVLLNTDKAAAAASWLTKEWVIEKSDHPNIPEGETYYGIRAQGTTRYINNNGGKGYMTTWQGNARADKGTNIKLTGELATYNTLKERALNAPFNAVHSLSAAARKKINDNTDNTVAGYKTLISGFSERDYIEFDQSKYYMLRDYTPANGNIFVLGADDDAANLATFTVPVAQAGSSDQAMTYSNINAIWKIQGDGSAADGEGLAASRTIARRLTHVNSGKLATDAGTRTLVEAGSENIADYYFVDLGAGQHFLKNAQYDGSGNQAVSMPLTANDNGTLTRRQPADGHAKNTRDAWYGIEVSSIKVTIGAAGYATLHLPFGVNLPAESDLKAYVVSATTDAKATMDEVSCIPANQGVILKGAANATYELTINDEAAWESVTNLLKGSNMHENITPEAGKTCYVLSMPAGAAKAGFYKAALNQENNTAFKNNDNKAYLSIDTPADGEAPSLSFVFDTETSINSISAAKADNVIYDLSGRRVKAATKGIFIMGGKKVIK